MLKPSLPRLAVLVPSVWAVVAASLVVPTGQPAADAEPAVPPEVAELLVDRDGAPVEPVPWEESESAAPVVSEPTAALPAPQYPEPAAWTVDLGGDGAPAAVVTGTAGPVQVVPSKAAAMSRAPGRRVTLEVLDRGRAERLGVPGFLFRLTDTADATLAQAAETGELPAELVIDYSGFATAYGGDFADRLSVVAFAPCGLRTPLPAGCREPRTRLATVNNAATQQLIVRVPDLAGLAAAAPDPGVTFGVLADATGETGSFAATDLSGTAQWQVAPGSGEFAYSYPIDVPEPGVGTAPTVGLGYSSGAVDGLTNGANTQASPVGVGWSFGTAFIERRYQPCSGTGGDPQTTDLCWLNQNGTISLEGISGTLLPINGAATEWVVHQDEGWRIQRLTGADNGVRDGEHWKVTGPDGTAYFFGLGRTPETGNATRAALAVPVVAATDTQPCWDQPLNVCLDMGYRWMLDRVVDPDGNVIAYHYVKERQRYALLAGFGGYPLYDRAALLDKIAYGLREGVSGAATARVLVGSQWRCNDLNQSCPKPDRRNGSRFPDVPNDLICHTTNCPNRSPTFFTGKRYSHVRTQIRVGEVWRDVVQTNFGHTLEHGKLLLKVAGQVGISQGGFLVNPATEFDYTRLANRVDVNEELGRKPMFHRRLFRITNSFGGQIQVTYGQHRRCAQDYELALWEKNDRDCFPQTMDHPARHTGVFHKYLVTRVVEDPRDGGPPMTTSYRYGVGGEDPAWAFNFGSFAQYDHFWGWSNWRGYATTTITQGSSTTRVRVFRGWDGDPLMVDMGGGGVCPCGDRPVTVTSLDGSQSFPDHQAFAGRVLEEQQLGTVDGQPGQVVSSTRYTYQRRVTHAAGAGQGRDADWAGMVSTTESVATAPGVFRQRGGTTSYNDRLQPVSSVELGWLDQTGDERCTVTTYAENPAANMFTYPAANRVVAGADCAAGEVLSESETYYDGSTVLGELPGPGRPTRERMRIDGDSWAETVTEFDSFGRPVRVTDPRGTTTTTAYVANPAHGVPLRTTVTNALGHATSTRWLPEFGVPLAETDPNGNVTRYEYDALGRTWKIWRPGHSTAGWPTWIFGYFPSADRRTVAAAQLTSPTNDGELAIEQSWTVYDGFWRERQTQTQSPTTGRVVVSETRYDARGQVRDQTAPQAVLGSPGEGLITGLAWDNRTRTLYDELGRVTAEQWLRGNSVAHETVTSRGADTVMVTGPEGNRVRETVDGLGRTVEVAEHDGDGWVTTIKEYDLAGNLTAVTGPEGNRVEYTYNLAGWRLTQTDPDRGTASFGYDIAGNQTSVTDGNGNRLHTSYDQLGRRTERRAGSAAGELLASWSYDTASGGVGKLAREARHTADGDWVSRITGYDHRGRAEGTTVTVPDSVPGVAGSYTMTQVYDGADRVAATTYPGIGGLPAETVATSYDRLGLARSMSGAERYVNLVAYDSRRRLETAYLGPATGILPWMFRTWSYDQDQRVAGVSTRLLDSAASTYRTVGAHEFRYDDAGNLTDLTVHQGQLGWRECFGYDARHRMTGAHTVESGATCAEGAPGTGDRPYQHSYRYSPDGNLLERVEDGQTTVYAYPDAGSERPHAPTSVGSASYDWDENGNLIERTADGATETFAWDNQNNLASVTGPDGMTRFVYDTSGQRLLRQTEQATTVYLFGQEVTVDAGGSVVDAVRSYRFGGQLIATRSVTQGVEYYVSGRASSLELSVPSGATSVAGGRSYEPYGQVRAEDGDGFATDRGFLGQIEDSGTGLSYLNARYYDPESALFLSPDPADTSTSAYSYAAGNPASFADPTGLSPAYISGLEAANGALRLQNKQLRGHIRKLNSHISSLQGVIRKQNRAITKLLTHIDTLNGIIRQQQSIIRQLENRVNYLISVVQRQQAIIAQLRATVAYQQRIINAQAARIRALEGQVAYYKGIVNQLSGRLWGHNPVYLNTVLNSIHSGNGIPAGAFAHDRITKLQTELALEQKRASTYSRTVEELTRRGAVRQTEIEDLRAQVDELRFQRNYYYADAMMRHSPDQSAINTIIGIVPGVGDAWNAVMTGVEFMEGPPRGLEQLPVALAPAVPGADVVTGCPANEAWCFLEYFPDPPDHQTGLR